MSLAFGLEYGLTCRRVERCSVGMTRTFRVEVVLHPTSDLSHLFFSMLVHRLPDEVIHNSSWTIMFEDDIVIWSEGRWRNK